MNKRDLNINETIFIDNIDWQDEDFGVVEDTIEYVTTTNHKLYITYVLTLTIGLDGEETSSLEVVELYVENPFGKSIVITDEEYDAIVDNFNEVIKW